MSGDRLPNPTPPFAGTVGRLINESEAVPLQGLRSLAGAPNVVLILLDDVAVREAVGPKSAHVHVPLEFQRAGQGPVPEIRRSRALRDRSPGACEQVAVFGRSAVESTGLVGLDMDQP